MKTGQDLQDSQDFKREDLTPPNPVNPVYFFSDAAAVQRLRNEAAEWLRTPFRPYSQAKGIGGGTDCVGLCEALMVAAGAVDGFDFPRTPADYSRHVHNDKILQYLRGQRSEDGNQSATLASRFEEIALPETNPDNPLHPVQFSPGDLLILKTGIGLYHMPIMLGDRAFIQCAAPDGVTEGDIGAPNYRQHLVALFRALPIRHSEIRSPK